MSSKKRRAFIKTVLGAALYTTAACLPLAGQAQDLAKNYPSGPVTIVVPYPAGGATDNLTRVVAKRLSEKWGKPVVVDNRSGGSGLIGAEYVARAKPDGLTFMHTLSTLVQAPHLYTSVKIDPVKDFSPISMSATNGLLWVVNGDNPAKTLEEFIAQVKANPNEYSYGTYGVGSTAHLYGYLLNQQAGINMVHVAYRGEAPSVVDLLGGQIPLVVMSGNGAKAHLETGRMRALAASGPDRSLVAPDTPTFTELGYKGMDVNGWYGFLAPAGTPPEIVNKISQDINEILADPEVKANFRAIDIKLLGTTPEDFVPHIGPHSEKWRKLIKEIGIEAQ